MEIPEIAALRDYISQVAAIKGIEIQGGESQQNEDYSEGLIKILDLKHVHRSMCESTEQLRVDTGTRKEQLNESSLQLQNLLYELQHYESEVSACKGFKSSYNDDLLELIPLQDLPPKEKCGLIDDDHQEQLNRLKHELASRHEAMSALDNYKSQRDTIAADVANKRNLLSTVESELQRLRSMSQQATAAFTIDEHVDSRAHLLPLPLYTLYTQLKIAALGINEKIDIQIRGDTPLLRRLKSGVFMSEADLLSSPLLASPPQQTGGGGGAGSSSSTCHPLSVAIGVPAPDSTITTTLAQFYYIPAINRVTVTGDDTHKLSHLYPDSNSTSNDDDNDALMATLNNNDDGDNITPPGKPYTWAQQVAGIDVLPSLPSLPGIGGVDMQEAVKALAEYTRERRAAVLLQRLL
jgi:hypothetical protein